MAKAKTKRINFTKAVLESLLDQHGGDRAVWYDTRQPGLIAELREGGTLTFYLYRWSNGKPNRLRIGAFPEVTIEQARDQCRKWISKQIDGVDLAAVKREGRQEPTLKDLFAHWLDTHAKLHKTTWKEDQRQFDNLLAGWHTRRLSAVKRSDVRALHARIGKDRGHYSANRLLALVGAMFNRAVEIGFDGPNPTKGIRKFKEESRDRFLQPTELPAFFAACDAEPNETLRDFFKVCLYTGARRGNVASMAWSDVNLTAATWRIPTTKSGEPVTIHLSAPAMAILVARKAAAVPGAVWVFPGGRRNMTGHLVSPKTAWARLIERGGFTGLRMHDLRRTLGSFQAAAGASLAVIGKSLGHKPGSPVTAIYARMNLDPVRASVDVAVAAIVAAAEVKEGGNDGKA